MSTLYIVTKKNENISFGLNQTVRERERERERERKRKAIFSLRFTGFYQSDLVRSRIKADLHDEGYAWVSESQDFAKVQGSDFHGNRENVVSREITPFEVGFLHMCVQRNAIQFFFFRPYDCILAITWPSLIRIE